METLVEIHSWFRWVVLAAMVVAVVYGFLRYRTRATWNDRLFALTAVLFDLQVALGIILWFGTQAWGDNAFIAYIHPVGMLVAVGLLHAVLGRARKQGDTPAYRLVATGFLLSLALTVGVIPWVRS